LIIEPLRDARDIGVRDQDDEATGSDTSSVSRAPFRPIGFFVILAMIV